MSRRSSLLSAAVAAVLVTPTAVVVSAGGGAASPAATSARPAASATTISVTGDGVATYPAFDPAVSRYGITTGSTTNGTVEVSVASPRRATVLVNGRAASGPTTVSGLEPGDEVSVIVRTDDGSTPYAFVYLPEKFPALTATVAEKPGRSPGSADPLRRGS